MYVHKHNGGSMKEMQMQTHKFTNPDGSPGQVDSLVEVDVPEVIQNDIVEEGIPDEVVNVTEKKQK